MLGLTQKLLIAFAGLLLILVAISTLAIERLNTYSQAIETIYRENYDSVTYAQGMEDALDDFDDLAREPASNLPVRIAEIEKRFDDLLNEESGNITLPGERDLVDSLGGQWVVYREAVRAWGATPSRGDADSLSRVRMVGREMRGVIQRIIDLNLRNAISVDGQIKQTAVRTKRVMYGLIVLAVVLAVVFTLIASRSILRPLRSLTRSAREIENGNLDLVVQVRGRDEVGQLAEAFNAMAAKLREYRRTDRAKLARTQRTTQLAIDSLPDAVAIISNDAHVEQANRAARELFGIEPQRSFNPAAIKALGDLVAQALREQRAVDANGYSGAIQVFDPAGVERFFLPHAVPIMDAGAPIGVTLVLADVTNLRKLDEMKSGLLSTVSHELKTPLQSIRMAAHLLLEERVGPVNPKQSELLIAARDDSDRLHTIINNLLDIGRIESGRVMFDLKPVPVDALIAEVIEPLQSTFLDKGVTLRSEIVGRGLTALVDADRLPHVFSNLLNNALRFTTAGGEVRITAERVGEFVRISVADTGSGIPADEVGRVFDRFFRGAGQSGATGAGLGLAIAKEIVDAHGGDMAVESEPGQGSCFHFTIKMAGVDEGGPRTP